MQTQMIASMAKQIQAHTIASNVRLYVLTIFNILLKQSLTNWKAHQVKGWRECSTVICSNNKEGDL